jgi:hypothetical protein
MNDFAFLPEAIETVSAVPFSSMYRVDAKENIDPVLGHLFDGIDMARVPQSIKDPARIFAEARQSDKEPKAQHDNAPSPVTPITQARKAALHTFER